MDPQSSPRRPRTAPGLEHQLRLELFCSCFIVTMKIINTYYIDYYSTFYKAEEIVDDSCILLVSY